jgi:hypothetical protein
MCPVMLSDACPFSLDVAHFHSFALHLAILRHVRIKLRDGSPFSPDVVRFHVFAHHLAIFGSVPGNTRQYTCPRHVK